MKKPKFEKLQVSSLRIGVLEYDTAYDAPTAARIAARRSRAGWSVRVEGMKSSKAFMTCEPSQQISRHDVGPHPKTYAKCTMTKAFKKRVQRR